MFFSKQKPVSASTIGANTFCAYQSHLRGKYGDDKKTKARLAYGDKEHETYNRTLSSPIAITLVKIVVAITAIVIVAFFL